MTDNWRFRVNWRGKLILQRRRKFRHSMDWWEFIWRDANVTDLAEFYRENRHD
jgi:hypothetical protein